MRVDPTTDAVGRGRQCAGRWRALRGHGARSEAADGRLPHRLLPALVSAQALGIVLADQGVLGVRAALFGAAGALLGGLCAPHRACAGPALALALCAGALGLSLRLEAVATTRPTQPQERTLEGRVERAWRSAAGLHFVLAETRAVDGAPQPVPVRIRVSTSAVPAAGPLDAGVAVRLRARLRAVGGRANPGASDPARQLARAGIGATAQLVDPALLVRVPEHDHGLVRGLAAWRRRVGERLAASGPGGGLLRALALGDAGSLAPGVRERFAALGLAHLLAVSGLHVGLVAALVYALAWGALARCATCAARCDARDPARLAAGLAAVGYAAAAGFALPVRRALVLLGVWAVVAGRAQRAPRFHPLWLAAGLLLAQDPAALFAPGAQLSFLACVALGWSAAPVVPGPDASPRLRRGLLAWRRTLRSSVAASAATAPLAALHFGIAAPLALPMNAIAVPWTALLLLPAALVSALAAAWNGPGSALVVTAGERLAAATLAALVALGEALPHRAGEAPHPLALLAAAALALPALRARRPWTAAGCAVAGAVLLCVAPPRPLAPPPPRLVALAVGSGDAILVQGRDATLLVDGGAARPGHFDLGASVVVPALRALGVRRLDLVIASHADVDHRGGLPAVLTALPVGEVWLPWGGRAEPGFAALRAAARRAGTPVRERGEGASAGHFGDLRVTPLWPPPEARGSRNERSLAVRVEAGTRRLLLLGDLGAAEAALAARVPGLRADVLVLPHHGSAGSTSAALLRVVRPRIAVASAPCPARRGLPHPATLRRVLRAGARLLWTGRDGAVGVPLEGALRPVRFATQRCTPSAAAQDAIRSTSRS